MHGHGFLLNSDVKLAIKAQDQLPNTAWFGGHGSTHLSKELHFVFS